MCIVSFYKSAFANAPGKNAVQLRGMATDQKARGQGFAKKLMRHSLRYFSEKATELIWCNARVSAIGFYEQYGFVREGREFDIPGVGVHVLMRRTLG
jgi:ribosomal protein S18 acetylase RimI-like enzyme